MCLVMKRRLWSLVYLNECILFFFLRDSMNFLMGAYRSLSPLCNTFVMNLVARCIFLNKKWNIPNCTEEWIFYLICFCFSFIFLFWLRWGCTKESNDNNWLRLNDRIVALANETSNSGTENIVFSLCSCGVGMTSPSIMKKIWKISNQWRRLKALCTTAVWIVCC